MASRFKGVGIIVSHNREKDKVVLPPDPSPAITNRFERFDTVGLAWTARANMVEARCGHAMHTSGAYIYAIGGTDGAKIHSSLERYNTTTNTWQTMAEMNTARCFFASVLLGGYIYCIGGLTASAIGNTSPTAKVERYVIATDTWEELEPAGYPLMMNVAVASGTTIHVLSGYKNAINTYLDRALTYNTTTDVWTTPGSALSDTQLNLFRRTLPFVFVNSGSAYVIDGLYHEVPPPIRNDEGEIISTPDPITLHLPDVYKYNLTTGVVTSGERDFVDLPKSRYSGATATISNTHYFLGGIYKDSNTLRTFETISVATSPFVYTDYSKMSRGRSSLAAAAHSTHVYVAGGVISAQNDNFLKVDVKAVPARVRLDGRQSANVRILVEDENGDSPSNVKVRLIGKGGEDDLVLFSSDEITVNSGFGLATLLPRSDDALGTVTMNDSVVRSYSVTVSGAVIDADYYGDTNTGAQPPEPGDGEIGDTEEDFASVTLPTQYKPLYRFETVVSADQSSSSSFFAANLASIGGFLSLRPLLRGGTDTLVTYYSDIRWLPQVVPLIETNEGEYADVRDALDRLSRQLPFGGSPIMDGIVRSAEIMDFDATGVNKIVYAMTDGQNNCSHHTTQDVLDAVNALKGIAKTPIVSSLFRVIPEGLYLDQGARDGAPEMELLSKETKGSAVYVVTDADVDESIRSLLRAKGFVGSGVFTFEVDLGEDVLIESLTSYFTIPDSNTDAYWRYAIGNDARMFTLLTDRIEPNETVELTDIHGRYVRFVAEFSATLEWDVYNAQPIVPPMLTSVDIVYHEKQEAYIYMHEHVTNNDPMQVVVTMDLTRPLGSDVLLGVHDGVTGSWDDYNYPSSPAVENSSRIVLPIRKSLDNTTHTLEKLVSVDGFVFEAVYGKWAQYSKVVVYKDGTDIVPSTEYKTVPHKGRIVFNYRTTDSYVISIENKPNVSVAAKIVNRVSGSPVQISGAGYMYSEVQPKPNGKKDKIVPEATNLMITPLEPNRDSVFRANYTYSDLRGRPEKSAEKGGTVITWFVNDQVAIDIQNLKEWDNKDYEVVQPGDVVYFLIEPATDLGGGSLLIGRKVRSLPVTVG